MPLMNHLSILARLPGSSAQSQGHRVIPHLCLSNFGEIRFWMRVLASALPGWATPGGAGVRRCNPGSYRKYAARIAALSICD